MARYGEFKSSEKVPSSAREIDALFTPFPGEKINLQTLGLLGRFASSTLIAGLPISLVQKTFNVRHSRYYKQKLRIICDAYVSPKTLSPITSNANHRLCSGDCCTVIQSSHTDIAKPTFKNTSSKFEASFNLGRVFLSTTKRMIPTERD
jgi:hypothetical protein